jgi:hypothetical protein
MPSGARRAFSVPAPRRDRIPRLIRPPRRNAIPGRRGRVARLPLAANPHSGGRPDREGRADQHGDSDSLADWRRWTGMAFGTSGRVAVPGALLPVHVSLEQDHAAYLSRTSGCGTSSRADRCPGRAGVVGSWLAGDGGLANLLPPRAGKKASRPPTGSARQSDPREHPSKALAPPCLLTTTRRLLTRLAL